MATIDPSVLQRDETGLLGSVRNTGLRDMSKTAFNADGSRASFSSVKDALGTASTIGRLASLAGTATNNSNLSQAGGTVSRVANIAKDPVGGLVSFGLQNTVGGIPAAVGMSAFNALRTDAPVMGAMADATANALVSKALFTASPPLAIANGLASVLGLPTIQEGVTEAVDWGMDAIGLGMDAPGWRGEINRAEESFDQMESTIPGMTTTSDKRGNVETKSNEVSIANQDVGTFGADAVDSYGVSTVGDTTVSTDAGIAAADKATFGDDSEPGSGWGGGSGGKGDVGNGGYGGATGGFQGSFGSGSVGGFR